MCGIRRRDALGRRCGDVVMGMLAGRRDELGRARTQVTGRLHRLLLELLSRQTSLTTWVWSWGRQAVGRGCRRS